MTQDTEAAQSVSLAELLRFFLPVGLASMMMLSSHTIIASGLSRTIDPINSAAAYYIALSLAQIVESPLVQCRQMMLALWKGPQSYRILKRLFISILALTMLIGVAIALVPPLREFVFDDLLKVAEELQASTHSAYLTCLLLPLFAGLRAFFQGMLMRAKETIWITIGMAIRLIAMSVLIWGFVRFGWVVGSLVGAVAIGVGVGCEGLISGLRFRKIHADAELVLVEEGKNKQDDAALNTSAALRFWLPLAAAQLMMSLIKPTLNTALGQTAEAAVAIAAYGTANSLAWIFIAPINNLNQATVVFASRPGGEKLVRRFILFFCIGVTALLLLLTLTPLGEMVLRSLMGADESLIQPILTNLGFFSFWPLLMGFSEYCFGTMMRYQRTQFFTLAKMGSLIVSMAAIALLGQNTGLVGVALGPICLGFGYIAEAAILGIGLFWLKRKGHSAAA